MMIRALSVLVTGVTLLLIGSSCERSSQPPALENLSPEERKAVDLAQAFLTMKGKDWGAATQVRPAGGEGVYRVTYPTPLEEVKRVGDRAVEVDTKADRVEFVPRR